MRLSRGIACILLVLTGLAVSAGAAEELALTPAAGQKAAVTILNDDGVRLLLHFELPRLAVETVELDGRTWHSITSPDAAIRGLEGRAALPVYSRLLALPTGAHATARIVAMETSELAGYRPAPIRPRDGEEPVIDSAWYDGKGVGSVPAVATAEPGVMHGLTVAPVTISPLGWDPASGRLTAATSMTIEVLVEGGAGKAASTLAPTSAFEDYFASNLLNYSRSDKSQTVEMGSWVIVHPNNATVLSEIQPLIEWRRRQGYNVVVASTAVAGVTNTAIKNWLATQYNTLKPALEFVTLVGDATGSIALPSWTESLSGYGGGGDHYYTMLDGFDILPDVHIGRLSAQNTSELSIIVDKIVNYETAPPMTADPNWFRRGSLVGDPGTSGITCVFVNEWAKDQLLAHGYTEIDEVYSGSFATQMLTNFSRGASLMTYRGWYGMSGMTESYINNLSNGGELGFAVIMTCDTGSFVSDTLCRSEAFLRAPNGGGVASIGTATTGTHTRYNNCMFTAVIDGTWNGGTFLTGTGSTNGKLAMYANYFDEEPDRTEIWMMWNNLMGDPATEIWTGIPDGFVVTHDAVVELGANAVAVTVTDDGAGLPVVGARVSLYKDGEVRITGVTDAAGSVLLPIAGYTAGDLAVTVTKHNHIPYRGTAVIGAATDLVALQTLTVGGGDGDALAEPGETVDLTLGLHNFGGVSAPGVTATLTSADPYVTVLDGSASYGTLAGGASADGDAPFVVEIADDAPAARLCALELTVVSGASSWTSLVEVEIRAGAFEKVVASFGGPGGNMDPGETGTLSVVLRNTGNEPVGGATATLISKSQFVSVTDGSGTYGALSVSGTGDNSGDLFGISIAGDCFGGHLAVFEMTVTSDQGAVDVFEFTAQVGNRAVTDPVGPDAYGYHIFDDGDTSSHAPTFSWLEIDPVIGGPGTDIGLTDNGWEEDDVQVVDLPFDFVYYGKSFDRISVCSNGWIAMGETGLKNYRNWALPCAGTPDAMICAFWDNLYVQTGVGGVFQWYDAPNHRLVIEWSRLRNDSGGGEETFQILLYDPAFHETDTGDGMIEMQFQSVAQVDAVNGYSTTGIQNLDRTDGLTYAYWNRYPAGAAAIASGRALRILPLAALPSGTLQGVVTNASGGDVPAKDVTVTVVDAGRSFVSAVDGVYTGSVPVGTYDVTASHPSFAPVTVNGVVITESQNTVVDFSLTDMAGPEFAATTVITNTVDVVGPYTIETEVFDYTGVDVVKAWFMTSQAPGVNQLATVLVDAPSGRRRILIPGQPLGTRVRYWFQATDVLGQTSWEPAGGPEASYSFRIENTEIVVHDMEADDGWARDPSDTATSGLWERVDPNGVLDNADLITPEDDFTPTGTDCWVTGQDPVGAAQGTNDVDGGLTTLLSPVFDLTGYSDVTVSYRRWYTNDTGFAPGTDVWRVEVSDDGSTWAVVESTTGSERSWQEVVVALDPLISMTANVRFRFIADDAGSGSVVEAAVDDFALHGSAGLTDSQAPTVTVTEPLPGAVISGNVIPEAAWDSDDNVGVTTVIVLYSTDAGATWSHWLGSGPLVSPAGSLDWPGAPHSNTALMKVICFDAALNAAADVTDGIFVLDLGTGAADGVLPSALTVGRNVPNPFNPRTEIVFSLPRDGRASLKVYDLAGRLVRTLLDGDLSAGEHVAVWNGETDAGERAASGVYFYRIDAGPETATRKMMLVK